MMSRKKKQVKKCSVCRTPVKQHDGPTGPRCKQNNAPPNVSENVNAGLSSAEQGSGGGAQAGFGDHDPSQWQVLDSSSWYGDDSWPSIHREDLPAAVSGGAASLHPSSLTPRGRIDQATAAPPGAWARPPNFSVPGPGATAPVHQGRVTWSDDTYSSHQQHHSVAEMVQSSCSSAQPAPAGCAPHPVDVAPIYQAASNPVRPRPDAPAGTQSPQGWSHSPSPAAPPLSAVPNRYPSVYGQPPGPQYYSALPQAGRMYDIPPHSYDPIQTGPPRHVPMYDYTGHRTLWPATDNVQGYASAHQRRPYGAPEHIDERTVNTALRGEFVNLEHCLTSCSNEYEEVRLFDNAGNIQVKASRPRKLITSFSKWLQAFGYYEALLVAYYGKELYIEMSRYRSFILELTDKYKIPYILTYDERNRMDLGRLRSFRFSRFNQEIFVTTLDGNSMKVVTKCSKCSSTEHSSGDCPFRSSHQGAGGPSGGASDNPRRKQQIDPNDICIRFQDGTCKFKKCPRRHCCFICEGPNGAKSCPTCKSKSAP